MPAMVSLLALTMRMLPKSSNRYLTGLGSDPKPVSQGKRSQTKKMRYGTEST